VTDAAGKLVPSQLLSLTPAELTVRRRALGLDSGSSRPPSSVSTLVFEVDVAPLGYATYYLTQAAPKDHSGSSSDEDTEGRRRLACSGGEETIAFTAGTALEGDGSSHVQIELDCATGQLASLRNPAERVGVHARQVRTMCTSNNRRTPDFSVPNCRKPGFEVIDASKSLTREPKRCGCMRNVGAADVQGV